MNCPRCTSDLVAIESDNVTVDLCQKSCGGIWFDWQELKKVDEAHETDTEFLDILSASNTKKIDLSEKLNCPHCLDIVMYRHFHSVKQKVEMDECPKCGGIWLDTGELTQIRKNFATDEERVAAAQKFVETTFGNELNNLKNKTEQKHAPAKKFGKALRFITPSYYLKKN